MNFSTTAGSQSPLFLTTAARDAIIEQLVMVDCFPMDELLVFLGQLRQRNFWEFPKGAPSVFGLNDAHRHYLGHIWPQLHADEELTDYAEYMTAIAALLYESINETDQVQALGEVFTPTHDGGLGLLTYIMEGGRALFSFDQAQFYNTKTTPEKTALLAQLANEGQSSVTLARWMMNEWLPFNLRFFLRIYREKIEQRDSAGSGVPPQSSDVQPGA